MKKSVQKECLLSTDIDLEAFADDPVPTWIFGVDCYRMLWGNPASFEFWDVATLRELLAKDFSGDSKVVRERIASTYAKGRARSFVREFWTIHPKGLPTTATMEMKSLVMPNGTRALLIRLIERVDLANDPTGLRLLDASQFLPVMVSTFTLNGEVLAQNPAAIACFADQDAGAQGGVPLWDRFADPTMVDGIRRCIEQDEVFQGDAIVRSQGKQAWHHVVARKGRDPVSGERIIVVTEQDISDRVRLSEDMERLNRDLEQRVQERTRELEQAIRDLEAENAERKRVEDSLRTNSNMTKSLIEAVPSPVFLKGADGRYLNCNDAFAQLFETPREEILGKRTTDLAPRELAQQCETVDDQVQRTGDIRAYGLTIRDDAKFTVYKALFHQEGNARPGIVGVVHDVTELKQTQARLEETANRLKDIAELSSDWFWELDADLRYVMLSKDYQNVMGLDPAGVVGKTMDEAFCLSVERHPDVWERYFDAVADKKDLLDFVYPCYATGKKRFISSSAKAVFDEKGQFLGYRGASNDVSDRIRATDVLRAREATLTQAQRLAKLGVVIWGGTGDEAVFSSEGTLELLGLEPGLDTPLDRWKMARAILSEDRDRREKEIQKSVGCTDEYDVKYRVQRPDGQIINIREVGQFAPGQTPGTDRMIVTLQDTTEMDKTTEHLRNVQRTESLRQVSSEIAHDFNNALAVVQGTLDLVNRTGQIGETDIATIMAACDQGARLTRRLLAYARQQPLHAKDVDVPELLEKMETLLSSAVGGAIEVTIQTDGSTWHAFADPGRIEDAVLNLAINSRDAMPDGGKLTICCRDVEMNLNNIPYGWPMEPGRFCVITVTDSGAGMTSDVRSRAFDPFYTTKEPGKGNGLGLSTVMGFCRQSDGHVTIDSIPGQGTTISMYLPARVPSQVTVSDGPAQVGRTGKGKAILVVEDDHTVQDMACRLLVSLGHRPICVDTAESALDAVRSKAPFDLILSDIVLKSGRNGFDLAEDIWRITQDQPILFMSGFAPDFHDRDIARRSSILTKPFSRKQLAEAIKYSIQP